MTRVVILAGGFGTRVKHLLPGLPKPMAPVCGRPFIEWVVRFFAGFGLNDFVLSTGYLAEIIEEHFAQQPVPGTKVICHAEREPLGTAGGFLNCISTDTTPVSSWLVANGDSLVFADPRPLLEILRSGRAEAALQGLAIADAARYGTLEIGEGGGLRAFREKRPGAGVINAGVYAFSHDTVNRLPTRRPLSFEFDVFPQLASEGRVAVQTVSAAPFLDIGTPETLAAAEAFISSNQDRFLSHDLSRL